MAFVKLDCGILDSTLWVERECREIFITALLMARPMEYADPIPQIAVRQIEETGWSAPPGWYGYVEAAGPGIIRRAGVDLETGIASLEKLGSPDPESRSPEYEGRRMIRIDGGYLILNFDKYRQKDHTSAKRSRAYRERKASRVTLASHTVTGRSVTQAEAEAEAYKSGNALPVDKSSNGKSKPRPPKGWWESPEGIVSAGKLAGLEAKKGESLPSFKARVEAALQ